MLFYFPPKFHSWVADYARNNASRRLLDSELTCSKCNCTTSISFSVMSRNRIFYKQDGLYARCSKCLALGRVHSAVSLRQRGVYYTDALYPSVPRGIARFFDLVGIVIEEKRWNSLVFSWALWYL